MEIIEIPALRNPVMIAAFGGWNDAAEAATGALEHLLSLWPHVKIAEVDSEEFYDFQVNRPMVSVDENHERSLEWPGTEIFGVQTPHLPFDLVILQGLEPSMRWRTFVSDLLDLADDLEVSMLVTMGSLLADSPHSRPISINASAASPSIARKFNVEMSRYEGPTGILGTFQDAAVRRGIDAVSLWAAVPHYASASPSPKASLALINSLEDFLDVVIPQGSLPEESKLWEKSVDQLAAEDSEIADYVAQLEKSKDATDLPEVTGDSIAREFERYLRRRTSD